MVSAYEQERKGFWHEPDGRSTSEAIALETWARTAHELLVETAGAYHAVLREGDLVERLQELTGIRTTRTHDRWLRKMLAPLAVLNARVGEPPLTALVVDAHGWVGERYDDVLRAHDELPITDANAREQHAARARLACYRWAGSAPEDGGVPASVPRAVGGRTPRPSAVRSSSGSAGASRSSAPRAARAPREPKPATPRRPAASDKPVAICPTCFMALPATGVCDNCG